MLGAGEMGEWAGSFGSTRTRAACPMAAGTLEARGESAETVEAVEAGAA